MGSYSILQLRFGSTSNSTFWKPYTKNVAYVLSSFSVSIQLYFPRVLKNTVQSENPSFNKLVITHHDCSAMWDNSFLHGSNIILQHPLKVNMLEYLQLILLEQKLKLIKRFVALPSFKKSLFCAQQKPI